MTGCDGAYSEGRSIGQANARRQQRNQVQMLALQRALVAESLDTLTVKTSYSNSRYFRWKEASLCLKGMVEMHSFGSPMAIDKESSRCNLG